MRFPYAFCRTVDRSLCLINLLSLAVRTRAPRVFTLFLPRLCPQGTGTSWLDSFLPSYSSLPWKLALYSTGSMDMKKNSLFLWYFFNVRSKNAKGREKRARLHFLFQMAGYCLGFSFTLGIPRLRTSSWLFASKTKQAFRFYFLFFFSSSSFGDIFHLKILFFFLILSRSEIISKQIWVSD